MLVRLGFRQGKACPNLFIHQTRGLAFSVHGDDFALTGTEDKFKWLEVGLAKAFEIKTKILGPEERHLQEVRVLNRVLPWTATGTTHEADPRHAEIFLRDLGVETCKSVTTPGAREDVAKASSVVVSSSGELSKEGE